ncbi:aspartyl protease family protein [Spirosoma gilvum]
MHVQRLRKIILFTVTYVLLSLHLVDAQAVRQPSPIAIHDNLVYLQVRVNGRGPFNFMFNSGLSGLGRIDQRLAKELNLNIVGFQERREGTQIKREFLVAIDKLNVGQVTHANLKLTVSNFNEVPHQLPIDGVIGRDFFNHYLVTIDGPHRQLIVSPDTLASKSKGVVRYTNPFMVLGKLGPRDVLFNLDIGSTLPLLFPKAILMGIHYTDTTNQRTVTQANTTFTLQEAVVHDELILGGILLKDQTIYYSDKAHQINVGVDFLKDHTFSFDQRKKLIRLE